MKPLGLQRVGRMAWGPMVLGLILFGATAFSQSSAIGIEAPATPVSGTSEIDLQSLFSRIEKETGLEIKRGPQVEGSVSIEAIQGLDASALLEVLLPQEGFGVLHSPDSPVVWVTAPIKTERFPVSPRLRERLSSMQDLRATVLGEVAATPTNSHGKDLTEYRLETDTLVARDCRPNLVRLERALESLEQEEIRNQAGALRTSPPNRRYSGSGAESGNLVARDFVVVPAEDRASKTPDAVHRRKRQVEMTEKIARSALYGPGGIEEAAAQGRVMYANPEEGTISVVDTPENLQKIEDYLRPTGGGASSGGGLLRIYSARHRTTRDLTNAVNGLVLSAY